MGERSVCAKRGANGGETTGAWGCAGKPAIGSPNGESRGSDRGNRVKCGEFQFWKNPLPATRDGTGGFSARRSTLDADPGNFVSEGPVLQARGLPEGDLVKALLTNWSIVPHACLFRRSILEKAGGFPEDIWVGEDQLLFLRCLLAGARVVHAPRTMVYYRVGDDPGKLTATGAPQKRHARDWGRFMLKANQEVPSGQCRVVGKRTCLTTECTESTEGGQGDAQGTCAGPSEPDSLTSKLADLPFSESLTRSASGPASLPATSHSLLATAPEALTTPSAWFGFRLRAYEAWRDLERFFPDGETELKKELQGIWKKNWFSGFRFQVSGFRFCAAEIGWAEVAGAGVSGACFFSMW